MPIEEVTDTKRMRSILLFLILGLSMNSLGQTIPFSFLRQANQGYFVFVDTNRSANMGGLAGANSWCLTQLTNSSWKGKSNASLSSSHVFAFLCDSGTCNNLLPSKQYFFARAGSTSTGGNYFITNGSGAGPSDSSNWDTSNKFGSTSSNFVYWSGRASGSSTYWSTSSHANTCSSWGTTSGGQNGRYGDTGLSGTGRWSDASTSCDTSEKLICFVNPN